MKQNTQKIIFISIYTLLFTVLIFVGTQLIFPNHTHEEKYVEPGLNSHYHDIDYDHYDSFQWASQNELDATIKKLIYENYSKKYSDDEKKKVGFRFIPSSLEESIKYSYLPIAEVFFYNRKILSKIQDITLLLYKNQFHTRGRMKDGNIHMYNPESLSDSEFLWVLIHEFWHYYDIHSLKWNAFWDVSQNFYDISWKSVTTIKPWMTSSDFVSGYSMTNQYAIKVDIYLHIWFTNSISSAFNSIRISRAY